MDGQIDKIKGRIKEAVGDMTIGSSFIGKLYL